MHLAQRDARQAHGGDHVERIASHQHHVGALHGHVGARADRESDVGLRERRRIVDAIADHADFLSLRLERFHLVGLLTG